LLYCLYAGKPTPLMLNLLIWTGHATNQPLNT
jgi:hypothetical protein